MVKVVGVVRQRVGLLEPARGPARPRAVELARVEGPEDLERHGPGGCSCGWTSTSRWTRRRARSPTTPASARRCPTIEELRGRGARLILVSHLGRPSGKPDAGALDGSGGRPPARAARGARDAGARPSSASSVRSSPTGSATASCCCSRTSASSRGRSSNDPELARELAALADLYVDDAFGVAHRAHASTEGVAHLLPAAAGVLLEAEVRSLSEVLERPARPLLAVLGGAKVADKIAVIDRFLELRRRDPDRRGDVLPLPVAPADTRSGDSLCDRRTSSMRRRARACGPARARPTLELPVDLVIATELSAERRAPRARRRRRAGRLDGARHRPPHGGRLLRSGWRAPARCSGTARWASSSWSRSRPAPGASPKPSRPARR